MNVEKVIRVLGYLLYTILWLPVIVLCFTITPIVWILMYIRVGQPVKQCVKRFKNALAASIKHDVVFLQTGRW